MKAGRVSLIMFRYTAFTSPAMLATKWHPNHAIHAEILFIEFPQLEKLIHDRFLLSTTSTFRHIARVFEHADGVEICADAVGKCKQDVQDRIRSVCCWDYQTGLMGTSQVNLLGRIFNTQRTPTQNNEAAKTPARYDCAKGKWLLDSCQASTKLTVL